MKRFALLSALACLLFSPASARENEYDVLSKTLTPFEKLFARESGAAHRAVSADLVLADMTNASAVPPGCQLHVALETPDKVFLTGPIMGKQIAACRNGKDIWGFPGAQMAAMLGPGGGEPPPDGSKIVLDDIVLPIPQKQLVFLPILFQVKDAGDETVDGETCTVLDVALLPQLAASLKVPGWTARLWVRPDYKPAKIDLAKTGWHIAVLVKKLDFTPALPADAWQPTDAQKSDVVHLKPWQLVKLAGLAGLQITP